MGFWETVAVLVVGLVIWKALEREWRAVARDRRSEQAETGETKRVWDSLPPEKRAEYQKVADELIREKVKGR